MAESHTFEHIEYDPETGEELSTVKVTYCRAVVRSALERRRLLGKLLDAYEYLDGDGNIVSQMPRDEWDNIEEYCSAMSQCKTDAAWWVNSNATPQEVRAAYELFLVQDPALHRLFQNASSAVMLPKKTKLSV